MATKRNRPAETPVVIRSVEDFDRLVPPTPPADAPSVPAEDPEEVGRRVGLEILRQIFGQTREEVGDGAGSKRGHPASA